MQPVNRASNKFEPDKKMRRLQILHEYLYYYAYGYGSNLEDFTNMHEFRSQIPIVGPNVSIYFFFSFTTITELFFGCIILIAHSQLTSELMEVRHVWKVNCAYYILYSYRNINLE